MRGLALVDDPGLALVDDPDGLNEASEAFRAARAITRADGIVGGYYNCSTPSQ